MASERDAEMGLPHPRRSEQQHVLLAFEESQASQFPQLAFVHRRLEGEVELIQSFLIGKVSPLGFQPHVPGMLGLTLRLQRLLEKLKVGEVLHGCLFGKCFVAVG